LTTVTLKYPVEHGGATYTELTLKRLNAGALAKLEAGMRERGLGAADEIRSSIVLLSLAAGIPEEVVNLLDAEDFSTANEAVADFLSGARSKAKSRK
jgi:hypothetical protein